MADADEFDEEYYSDGEELAHDEEDEDGDELIPDHIVSLKVVKGKRLVEVVFKGQKQATWIPEDQFLYPGMVKRFETESKKKPMEGEHRGHSHGGGRGGPSRGRGDSRGGRGGRGGSAAPSPAPPKKVDREEQAKEAAKVEAYSKRFASGDAPAPVSRGFTYASFFEKTLELPPLIGPKQLPFHFAPLEDRSPPYDPFAGIQLDAAAQASQPAKPAAKSAEEVGHIVRGLVDELPSSVDLSPWKESILDEHVRELAWTCHSLTRVSLHGCRAITHKSLKALGDAPNLTSVDLSGARVTINGFVTLCSKAAKRMREINLNGMLYHRTQPEPAPGSNNHTGCMPFVQAAIRLCHGLQVLRCVDAVPVLPVSPLREELQFMAQAPAGTSALVVFECGDWHTQWADLQVMFSQKHPHMRSVRTPSIANHSATFWLRAGDERDMVALSGQRQLGRMPYPPLHEPLLFPSAPGLLHIKHLELLDVSPSGGDQKAVLVSATLGVLLRSAKTLECCKIAFAGKVTNTLKGFNSDVVRAEGFPELHTLVLENVPWVDDTFMMDVLPRAPLLQTLGLEGSTAHLSAEVLGAVAKLAPHVRALHLTLTDDTAATLGAPPLVSLRLTRSPVSVGVLVALLKKHSATLRQLDLNHSPFTLAVDSKELLAAIDANCPKIQELRVYHCGFRWERPEKLDLAQVAVVQTCGCTVARTGAAMLAWRGGRSNVQFRTERCMWEHW